MKHIIFLILLSIIPICSSAQTTIEMEESNGVYKIPCKINGAKMKFIFDTGASDICISKSIAEYLLDNDYISPNDFIKTGQSIVADGRIIDNLKINIKDIEIAGEHLSNVPAIVTFGQSAPLLLGVSAIQMLGKFSINGNKLIIYNTSNEQNLSDSEIDTLFEKAKYYYNKGLWSSALECYNKLYFSNVLNDYGLRTYSKVLHKNHEYEKALNIILQIKDYDSFIKDSINIFDDIASCYYFASQYKNALLYYEKAIIQNFNDNIDLTYIYYFKYLCNMHLERYREAIEDIDKLFKLKIEYYGIDTSYFVKSLAYELDKKQKRLNDDMCDEVYIDFLYCMKKTGHITHSKFIDNIIYLAGKRQKYAIMYCEERDIDWESLSDLQHSLY